VRGGDDVAPRVRIAVAAALMASGLLIAGTGASLALAAPEPGGGGDTSGTQSEGTAASTGDPAPATTGAPVPGGVAAGAGSAEGGAKPSSQVGDGRNGLAADSTATAATGTETAPTTEALRTTEAAPTTISTEPSSKLSEADSTPTPQTGGASSSEQARGSATRLANGTEAIGEGGSSGSSTSPGSLPPTTTGDGTKDGDGTKPPDEGEHQPGLGWLWSWWLGCPPPGLPPGSVGGSDGTHVPPAWKPPLPPAMRLPVPYIPREIVPELPGIIEPFLDAVTGLATAASEVPFAPITLPVIVIPSFPAATGVGGGGGAVGGAGGPGAVPRPGIPAAPKPPASTHGGASKPQPTQSGSQQGPPPAFSAGNQALPAPSYRMGYMEYLRAAGFGQVAAVAVPGLSGILILTGAGGLIGYRQARAGRSVRTGSTARFMG
jgi:hypothetical protein